VTSPKDGYSAISKLLDELRTGAEQAERETSPGWTVTVREDGTAQIYASSLGPARQVVPIAETSARHARYIARAASPRVVLLLLKMIADRDRMIALHALSREMAEADANGVRWAPNAAPQPRKGQDDG
jgi:hypothetical protein